MASVASSLSEPRVLAHANRRLFPDDTDNGYAVVEAKGHTNRTDAFSVGGIYHSPTVFQLKAMLYHAGLLTSRGAEPSNLDPTTDLLRKLETSLVYAPWMGARHTSTVDTSVRDEVVLAITLSEETGRVALFRDGTYEDYTRENLSTPWRADE